MKDLAHSLAEMNQDQYTEHKENEGKDKEYTQVLYNDTLLKNIISYLPAIQRAWCNTPTRTTVITHAEKRICTLSRTINASIRVGQYGTTLRKEAKEFIPNQIESLIPQQPNKNHGNKNCDKKNSGSKDCGNMKRGNKEYGNKNGISTMSADAGMQAATVCWCGATVYGPPMPQEMHMCN